MEDPEVSDVLVNGPFEVWVDRLGQLTQTNIKFDDEGNVVWIDPRAGNLKYFLGGAALTGAPNCRCARQNDRRKIPDA